MIKYDEKEIYKKSDRDAVGTTFSKVKPAYSKKENVVEADKVIPKTTPLKQKEGDDHHA